MRLAAVLVVALLAGCAQPEPEGPKFYATGIVATAEYPLPVEVSRIVGVAKSLGWRNGSTTEIPDGFNVQLLHADGTEILAQKHPSWNNWTLTHVFRFANDTVTRHDTEAGAKAGADARWPEVEGEFEAMIEPFEDAGRWERIRVRTACYCASDEG